LPSEPAIAHAEREVATLNEASLRRAVSRAGRRHIIAKLNEAWRQFWRDQSNYPTWENVASKVLFPA